MKSNTNPTTANNTTTTDPETQRRVDELNKWLREPTDS
ncbi:hypothetical protein EV13_0764 [Prochlorococcus sp. MIT 0702]|nr:hypothetical protein EV12_0278 [Prochlorococcus sp. MIT 0701]KGG29960.1 hypothetical protein EV13_0764 [Prochlorococcus sp. MIT 0702]KGG36962.1 hypothetical protein EV14_0172 [Prochlorococcus sp. MIT 0703]